jgi:replication factor A1
MFIDVLGRLKAIQPVEKVLVRGQELEDKREFILENIRFVKDSFFLMGCNSYALDIDLTFLSLLKR